MFGITVVRIMMQTAWCRTLIIHMQIYYKIGAVIKKDDGLKVLGFDGTNQNESLENITNAVPTQRPHPYILFTLPYRQRQSLTSSLVGYTESEQSA